MAAADLFNALAPRGQARSEICLETILIVVLLLALIGAWPRGRIAKLGILPDRGLGIVLVIVLVLLLLA